MSYPFKPGPPPVPRPPMLGQPAMGQPAMGQPVIGQPTPGRPNPGQPVMGRPTPEPQQVVDGQGTGHPAVDEVLRSLENAAQLPPAEQIAEFEAAHQVLQETLASIDG